MRRSIALALPALDRLAELARAAEQAGFHRLWTTETPTRDAIVRCLALAAATERIELGTGIAYAFTRHPLATATMAADVHAVAGGRFTLGLGTGTRGLRARYGVEWERPGARLAEYVRLVKAAWAARDGVDHQGAQYRAAVPGFALCVAGLRVYGAAVNARMLRRVLEVCDGVLLHAVTAVPEYYAAVVAPALNGKPAALWRITAVAADAERARERAKRTLAFYFTTPSYGAVVAGTAWERPVTAIRDAFRAGERDWARLAAHVPEPMVDGLALAGNPHQVREQLDALVFAGVDELVLQTAAIGLDADEANDNCAEIINVCAPRTVDMT